MQTLKQMQDDHEGDPWFYLTYECPDGTIGYDGMHSGVEGVAEARKLTEQIFGGKYKNFKMVVVMDAPDPAGKINEEAAAICQALVSGDRDKLDALIG